MDMSAIGAGDKRWEWVDASASIQAPNYRMWSCPMEGVWGTYMSVTADCVGRESSKLAGRSEPRRRPAGRQSALVGAVGRCAARHGSRRRLVSLEDLVEQPDHRPTRPKRRSLHVGAFPA